MTISWRVLVAAAVIWFAFQGNTLDFQWPDETPVIEGEPDKPSAKAIEWVKGVDAARMLPSDRMYLVAFYSAMAFVIERDATLKPPVIDTTVKFADLHAGSLDLAIEERNIGKYPGLGAQIDQVFLAAVGDDVTTVTPEKRAAIVEACRALAWRFHMYGEE